MLRPHPYPPPPTSALKTLLCTLTLSMGWAGGSLAQAQPEQTTQPDATPLVRFSGFGSLGVAHANADGATFVRDITQPKGIGNRGLYWEQDSRLGVQGNLQLNDDLELVTQIVSRYRQGNDFHPEVTWAFVKYTPHDMVELRLGRIGFDGYPGADTRDVGYSYLWVRPPVEYFGTLLFPYEDGADIVLRHSIADGLLRAKLYTGITRQQASSLMQQREWAGGLNLPPIGSVQDLNKSRVTGGFLEYQDMHWTARLGMARTRIQKDFPQGSFNFRQVMQGEAMLAQMNGNFPLLGALQELGAGMQLAGKHTTFKAINLAYEDGPLQTQLAFSRMDSNTPLTPNYKAGYASAGYRIGKLTPYVTTARIQTKHSQIPQRLGQLGASPMLTSVTHFMLESPMMDRHTWSVGVRYDIANNLALKMQLDSVRDKSCSPVSLPLMSPGTPCPPPLLSPTVPVNWDGRAQIYSAVLDFTF